MQLQSFDSLFRDLARAEARLIEAPGLATLGLETKYFLREYFCNEPGCDCRRVVVCFLPYAGQGEASAAINYGWEKAKYYRKLTSDPKLALKMAGASLEPTADQGPHARHFLLIFRKLVEDHMMVARFRRHYRLFKTHIERPTDLPL